MDTIESARQEKKHAMARHEMVHVESRTVWGWLWGAHNFRPGVLMLAALLFAALYFAPAPRGMLHLLSSPKTGDKVSDPIAGYSGYMNMAEGETIAEYYSRYAKRTVKETDAQGAATQRPMTAQETAQKIRVMVGVLFVAAILWATGAMPLGIKALLVGTLMYTFGIFPPDMVAAAYAKDAVFFIAGVLALSAGIAKTGLDRRIGLLLLGTSRSWTAFLFLFLPLLAVTAAFLSEHALVAFIAPILVMVYLTSIREAGIAHDRAVAVMLILGLCYAANQGGPGSPAAGGRNAVMVGILSDYGLAPSFGDWVKYGLPFVPVMSLVISCYFFLRLRRSIRVKDLNVAKIVKKESERIGPMNRAEYTTAAVLVGVIFLWIS